MLKSESSFILPRYICSRRSKAVHQIANSDAHGFGYPQQSMEANPLLAALNFANVHGMKVGLFRKLFLAQASFFAALPNRIAQNLEGRLGSRHSGSGKQAERSLNTPNMGLFLALSFPNQCHTKMLAAGRVAYAWSKDALNRFGDVEE